MMLREQLMHIMECSEDRAERYLAALNEAMEEYAIVTPSRQMAFLAQVGHESGRLRFVRELASGGVYDGRADLGNTEPDAISRAMIYHTTPGPRWRGRGLIQITGYANYKHCGLALSLDLLDNPSLLELPVNAARSAGWFWQTRNLNAFADVQDFDGISDIINRGHKTKLQGDANGYADRVSIYNRAKEALAWS